MIKLNRETKYLPFLMAIPVVLIAMIIGGNSAVDFQIHDTYFVIGKLHIVILFTIILSIKSGLYFLSREVPFVSFFYKADVVITLLIVCLGFYFVAFTQYNPVTVDTLALLSMAFASWILIQLLVGANYLFLMFFGE